MNQPRTPSEIVVRAAKLYHHGVICPAESWHIINDATISLDVRALLNGLSESDQELIRRVHVERPLSLESLAESMATEGHYGTLLDWCIESGSSLGATDGDR